MSTLAALCAALLLDMYLGEPARWHPLVGFGNLACRLERCSNSAGLSQNAQLGRGALALLVLVLPLLIFALLLAQASDGLLHWCIAVTVLYFSIGHTSLRQHAGAVSSALAAGNMVTARKAVSMLVSRDTSELNATQASAATVESVLENGCDAIFGALFWFAVGGIPGAILYRLVNTLDAMWGYKNARFLYFGRAAARLDDVLNWIPARLTAASYTILGNSRDAWRCWQQQGSRWKSPNAGPVMAAGAGALGIQLGGTARYHGEKQQRPLLGCGHAPQAADIDRALALITRSVWLWLLVATFGSVAIECVTV